MKQEIRKAMSLCDGSFLAGSYLVDPEAANDIDIVFPEWGFKHSTLANEGFEMQHNPELYTNCPELVATYRKGSINVLVVSNFYVPAYFGAAQQMMADPKKYPTRNDRIKLHGHLKGIISEMTAVLA